MRQSLLWMRDGLTPERDRKDEDISATICNKAEETIDKTCKDILSRMQTSLNFFVKTKIDLF